VFIVQCVDFIWHFFLPYQVIYQLCACPDTSGPTMRYLRTSQDFLFSHLQHLPFILPSECRICAEIIHTYLSAAVNEKRQKKHLLMVFLLREIDKWGEKCIPYSKVTIIALSLHSVCSVISSGNQIAALSQMSWLMKTAAIELRVTSLNRQRSHTQRLVNLLLDDQPHTQHAGTVLSS